MIKDYMLKCLVKMGVFTSIMIFLTDVLKYTWNLQPNYKSKKLTYYVRANINKTTIQLHKFIMDKSNNFISDPSLTIDHIDRNPLNNRKYNLRWATYSEQRKNTNKAYRRKNATPLPDGITQEDMPKYVGYTKFYSKGRKREIEYFFIKRHPSGKRYQSSTSVKISIHEKI